MGDGMPDFPGKLQAAAERETRNFNLRTGEGEEEEEAKLVREEK